MAMDAINSYSGYTAQNTAGNSAAGGTKKKDTERTAEKTESSKSERTAEYMNKLAKLAPSVEFGMGSTHSAAQNGKTLTINPKLLEKMQKDPRQEKETKELIKGVESATKLLDSIHKASGWTVVYRHGYIDENGKFSSCAYVRNEFGYKMSEELREERRENSEKLIEKSKEKAAKKKEELQEALEEKRTEKGDTKTDKTDKAEELVKEKMADSKDGIVYLYDSDIRTIMEAAKEDDAEKTSMGEQTQIGANLDLKL